MAKHINERLRKAQSVVDGMITDLDEFDRTIVDIESNHSMYFSYDHEIHGNRMIRSKYVRESIRNGRQVIKVLEEAIAAHKNMQVELSTVRRDNKNLRGSLGYYINKEREEENAKLGYERSICGRIKKGIEKIRRIYTGN
tara:strand:- start:51 stop:470 length:420 start_codon:yes stop_codon:yes gene_type:complete